MATTLHDADATAGNRRLAINARALEILRQHTGAEILTLAEAVRQATVEIDKGE